MIVTTFVSSIWRGILSLHHSTASCTILKVQIWHFTGRIPIGSISSSTYLNSSGLQLSYSSQTLSPVHFCSLHSPAPQYFPRSRTRKPGSFCQPCLSSYHRYSCLNEEDVSGLQLGSCSTACWASSWASTIKVASWKHRLISGASQTSARLFGGRHIVLRPGFWEIEMTTS